MRKDAGAEKLLERSDLKFMFAEASRFAANQNWPLPLIGFLKKWGAEVFRPGPMLRGKVQTLSVANVGHVAAVYVNW